MVGIKFCAHCESEFHPVRPMQAVCSAICASRKVRKEKAYQKALQAQARATLKKRKEAIKTIPQLIKEAQIAFNAYIRARDAEEPCISCGAPPPDLRQLHGGRDAGHYRSTGAAAHLRFDDRNCHAQCVRCNQHLSGNAVAYRAGLVDRIGLDAVEALEADNSPVKWGRDTLRQIKTAYRAKTRQLLKERA